MKTIILGLAMVSCLVGCEQETTIEGGCGNDGTVAETGAPFVVEPLNKQCASHDDCASGECVPIVGAPNKDAGSCWSDRFVGCEQVNFDGWVVDAFCGDRELFACQTNMSPQMMAHCTDPSDSLAPWIASFQCCDLSF